MKYIICILLIVNIFSGTDLYVGYSGKNNNFNTIQEAVNKAANLGPKDESSLVTIHIAPGTYRQQVMVEAPYITFVNDEPSKGEALLTWYYGIGYKYYSASDKGVYNANLQNTPCKQRWGATVLLINKASYFKAKVITFENSFNRYMTNEEIADGVEVLGDANTSPINLQRNSGLDVKSKAATERETALAADCGYAKFLNCKFYSSQDTLYTGGSPLYFKNYLIEEQTDYIFGESNEVFDSCELRWKGYSSGSVGGYITTTRAGDGTYNGYLMYNCKLLKINLLQ